MEIPGAALSVALTLPDHTGEPLARKKLAPRGTAHRLSRLFSRATRPELAHLPRMEFVLFPHYIVRVGVYSRKGPGEMLSGVEAWSGSSFLLELADAPEDRDPDAPTFPPRLDHQAATAIARQELTHTIMRQRSRGPKPELKETLACDLVYFPFWIYYFARRGSFVDIRVLNGATGELVGNRTRTGVLDAFMAAGNDHPI